MKNAENIVTVEKELEMLKQRAHQLKEKRPGCGEILDFYVKVKEAQAASSVSSKIDPVKLKIQCRNYLDPGGFCLIQKENMPVDIEASSSLFHTLCCIAKKANPFMAEQAEKISVLLKKEKMDLKQLLTDRGDIQRGGHAAKVHGLDIGVLSFLIHNSIRPWVEALSQMLGRELEPESWQKNHCPICGSAPGLNLLKGKEGKRYSHCSYCGCQWRIERLSCALCGNRDQAFLKYYSAEGEEDCRIDSCDKCHHYVKTIDDRHLETSDPCLEDLGSLHLDVVAVQKGYKRSLP